MYKTKAILFLAYFLGTILLGGCNGQTPQKRTPEPSHISTQDQTPLIFQENIAPDRNHADLNGRVTEFVRKMYQDSQGNFWLGTNGNGVIRYDNNSLQQFEISEDFNKDVGAVRGIVEDKKGNIWLGTSNGLIKFDGEKFKVYSANEGLPNNEVWGLTIDEKGLLWLGTTKGVYQFDGKNFTLFELPKSTVKNPEPMLNDQLAFKILQDRNGTMWFVVDGNGIYTYKDAHFKQWTESNGLTDNQTFDIFEDTKGNIWIGTFNGGVSKYDGNTFYNYTKENRIEGLEAYNFMEDKKGNMWFSAENHGVYRYDGKNFTQFTVQDGLATNTIQHIFEDRKGQIWLSTWKGISVYDGKEITDLADKEPWTK